MGLLFSLISITVFLAILGALLALPMYLPALSQFAPTTLLRRRLIKSIFALATFIICLAGLAYIDAIVTNNLSSRAVERPFVAGSEQDALLTRELWLQNIVLPSVRQDCYTNDIAVCNASNDIEARLDMNASTEYIILLAHALIAMFGNILMSNYILRDDRKKKSATLITG